MNPLQIGWASRCISTDKALNMPGQFYLRIGKGSLDPLYTTALVLESGDDLAIFVSGDLIDFRCRILDLVREEVEKLRPQIPVEKIVLNATHTHACPSHLNGIGSISFPKGATVPHDGIHIDAPEEYRTFLVQQMRDAIIEAYDNRKTGGFSYGYGFAVVGFQRRVVYFDDISKRPGTVKNSTHGVNGHAKMYGNTADEQFSHYEAGADPFVNLLFTFDEKENLTGAIVNIPCPSQCSETERYYSADYWHDIRTLIRKTYGDIFILPQCAAAGDLSPKQLHYKKAQERRFRLKYGENETLAENKKMIALRRDIAERVKCAFDEVFSWAKKEIIRSAPLSHEVIRVPLPKRLVTEEEYEAAQKGLEEAEKGSFTFDGTPEENLKANSIVMSQKGRYLRIINRYENQDLSPLPMEMHVIRLGDIAFATNRFEIFCDYQHRIQARSPFEQTFIVQLCAQPELDNGSYLPTERGLWGKGFGASVYDNQVTPAAGQKIVEETVSILNKMAEKE